MAAKKVPEGYLFSKGYTYYVFALVCLLMMFDFADRMIISSILPLIKKEWLLTDAQCGLLSTAVSVCMFLFVVPVSILVDRWSRRKAAALMSALWSIACAAGAFVTSFPQLLVTRSFIGIGEAAYAPAGVSLVSALFPEKRRAVMIGTFNAFIGIGMVVGMMAGAAIAVKWGWRHALGIVALPGLIIAVLMYFTREYKTIPLEHKVDAAAAGEAVAVKLSKKKIILDFFKTRSLLTSYISFATQSFVYMSIVIFLPTYYMRTWGVSLQQASTMTSIPLIILIFGGPAGGWIMDKWMLKNVTGRMYFPTIAYALAAIFMMSSFGLVSAGKLAYILLLVGFFMHAMAGGGPICVTQEVTHPGVRAMTYGVGLVFQHLLGSAPGPLVSGLISDKFGLNAAMIFASSIGLVSALVLFIGAFYYKKDRDKVEKVILQAEN
jgi:MFS transporter, Spinster family, sphingosine-1-phosphate transporter